ncbi:MAG: hypothetical protein GKR90_24160 [Pseudomonadales bacterium]|nr:hypothetical protein [Pseudomonadales bacterium]
MLKSFHMALALLSFTGFLVRAGWAYKASDLLKETWVRVVPHVVDTLLLVLGVVLAFSLAGGFVQGWLFAKLIALVAYIGFGVMTLRGEGHIRDIGFVGAILAFVYMLTVAFSREVWPF